MNTFCYWSQYFEDLLQGRSEHSVFIKFMILWMGFNSYYSNKYQRNGDKICIDLVAKEPKAQEIYNDNRTMILQSFSEVPSKYCSPRTYVKDMRVQSPKDALFDREHSELSNFLTAVYQVRCNLFHGDKTPNEDVDVQLVSWAYVNLLTFLKEYLPDNFEY